MSDCQNCQDSILSKTKSLITNPSCSEECPDISCEIITYPTCIPLEKSYSCLQVPSGSTLTDFLDAVELRCASGQPNSGTVKATSTDGCQGYLYDKIDSNTLNITVLPSPNPSGLCETVYIEEKDWTWVTLESLVFANGWGKEVPSINYAEPAIGFKNDEVRFRGAIKTKPNTSYSFPVTDLKIVTGTLSPNYTPSKIKKFNYIAPAIDLNNPTSFIHNWYTVYIIISNTGQILFNVRPIANTVQYKNLIVSLDHISYIK